MSTPFVSKAVRPFGFRDKIGYMFGDFGNDFTFLLQALFFTVFYTNAVGIKPAHVGLLLLVARLVDAFTDVGMGIIVDRTPVRAGGTKFKRWIKYVMVPVAVASSLMYMSFAADFGSYSMRVVWMCATYFLWGSICYTAINIPYGSMASVISPNPDDRAQLSVFRSTGAMLAQLFIMSVLPLIVYVTNEAGVSVLDPSRMTASAIVCSVAAVLCYTMCYLNVEERVEAAKSDKEKGSIGDLVKALFTNRALGGLVLAALILLVAGLFMNGMLSYLFLNYFGNGKIASIAGVVSILPTLTLIVLGPLMAKRFGKAEVSIVAMSIAGVVLIVAYFMHIQNVAIWLTLYAIASFCNAVFNFLVWAFIIDVIDYQEIQSGQRDDATVYAVYSWARKLGQALAGGLTGWALGWIGFNAEVAKAGGEQTAAVNDSIYMLANLVPGILFVVVAVAIAFLYPLKKAQVEANAKILEDRREAAQA